MKISNKKDKYKAPVRDIWESLQFCNWMLPVLYNVCKMFSRKDFDK